MIYDVEFSILKGKCMHGESPLLFSFAYLTPIRVGRVCRVGVPESGPAHPKMPPHSSAHNRHYHAADTNKGYEVANYA